MRERVEGQPGDDPARVERPAPRHRPAVERVLSLQRAAGNAAVTRWLAREDDVSGRGLNWDPSLLPPDDTPLPMDTPVVFVFILGAKDDAALATAEAHYRSVLMSSPSRRVIVRDDMADPTLAGIFDYLSVVKHPIAEITLVVHGNPEGVLLVPLDAADTDESTTPAELEKALHDGVLKPLRDGQITARTRIRLQACFSGHGPRMVNLLDRAFGDGAGTVVAPTVEVAFAKDIWHSEGLSGWWITSPTPLTSEELAVALKAKYGPSLKALDRTTYQEDTGGHRTGEPIADDDAMWAEIARLATEESASGADGQTQWVYIASAFVQGVKPGYEHDPVLYTKSVYYSPTDI